MGVVGTAHCVKSRLFQLADSTIRRVGVLRRSDNSVVVMDAAAPQFYGFSIDPESMAGIQLQPADTEGSLLLIQNLILLQNAGPVSIPDKDDPYPRAADCPRTASDGNSVWSALSG